MKNSMATFAHTGIKLNSHLPGNPPVLDRTLVQNHIGIDRLVIRPQYRDLKEPLHLAQGGTAGRVHKGMLSMQAQGRILVPNATQAASMEDQEKALRLAFDPYECYRDSPTTDGVYALSWLEPTLDTTNYASGWMPVTRYVRPVAQPETEWSITDQSYRSWAVGLVAPDPRLYDTTLGYASPAADNVPVDIVNKGSIAGPLRATMTMFGAGSAYFKILRPLPLHNPGFNTADFTDWTVGWAASPNGAYVESGHATLFFGYGAAHSPEISQVVTVGAGVPITLSMLAQGVTSSDNLHWWVQWLKADGSTIAWSFRGPVTVSPSTMTFVTDTSPVAPPLTASARVGITNDGVGTNLYVDDVSASAGDFGLNLSGCVDGDVVVATMETCGPFGSGKSIVKNGVPAFSLKTTGPTSWLAVPPGASTLTAVGTTNANVVFEWGHARP